MKITKKAKKVKVIFREQRAYRTEYECPSCKTNFIGTTISNNTISFTCKCGQLLFIETKEVITIDK